MNKIKFKSEFLSLNHVECTGVYDQEIDGVTTIINFNYEITYYNSEYNECETEIHVNESTQFIDEGMCEKHMRLMKSEYRDLKNLVFDEVNSDPIYMMEYVREGMEYYNEF